MAKEKKVMKKWEIFAGRNRFYCDGRLMTAPHGGVFLLTIILITGTCALFFTYDCKYLAENVTIAIPIVGGLLFLFTMSSLLRTSLSDPGIIPRATSEEAAYVEKEIEVTNSANSPTYRPPPRTKEVLVKGQTVKLKYCFTCKIFRPPRASHCSLCDNCVDRFDHHCPWVGNCVGRRNYRFFYMFIVSLAFLAVFIFSCAIAHLILITKDDKQFLDAVKESPPSVVVAIICFFSVWSILGLAGFHTYLTTSNQTTNEDIKGSFASKRGHEHFNPYSQGNVCLNCFYILCGPVTPSLLDRRGIVTDEYKNEINRHCKPSHLSLPLDSQPNKNGLIHLSMMSEGHETTGIYRQTTENSVSNADSYTHLVSNEQPLSILTSTKNGGPRCNNNDEQPAAITASITPLSTKQRAAHQQQQNHRDSHTTINMNTYYSPQSTGRIISNFGAQTNSQDGAGSGVGGVMTTTEEVVELAREIQQFSSGVDYDTASLHDDLNVHASQSTHHDKTAVQINSDDNDDNSNDRTVITASRLKFLQDTTMIESALDLDSLDDINNVLSEKSVDV